MSSIIYNNSVSQVVSTSGGITVMGAPGVTYPVYARWGSGPALGRGIRGISAQVLLDTDTEYRESEQIRFTLRNAWNTKYVSQLGNKKRIIGPFRAVNNAGDVLCRPDYSCGGPCQTFQSRPGMFGLRQSMGHIQSYCDGTGVPPTTCNTKYVYDSSDYTTYLKQQAVNRNYNNISNGGNNNSGSQSAYRAIRRR
jgi:hypothetical protein